MSSDDLDWEIRPLRAADTGLVRDLLVQSFETDAEADLVETLRRDGDAEIELVAESGGDLVGYAMLSAMTSPEASLSLGPVATTAAAEGRGVAGSLIESGLAMAAVGDAQLVFVLGDPVFYERFGFELGDAEGFESPYEDPYWQVARLDDEAPHGGAAVHAEAFGSFE